jgi:hypothetical protein
VFREFNATTEKTKMRTVHPVKVNHLFEYALEKHAKYRHAKLKALGYRPFSIFKTARGTYAFWVG